MLHGRMEEVLLIGGAKVHLVSVNNSPNGLPPCPCVYAIVCGLGAQWDGVGDIQIHARKADLVKKNETDDGFNERFLEHSRNQKRRFLGDEGIDAASPAPSGSSDSLGLSDAASPAARPHCKQLLRSAMPWQCGQLHQHCLRHDCRLFQRCGRRCMLITLHRAGVRTGAGLLLGVKSRSSQRGFALIFLS